MKSPTKITSYFIIICFVISNIKVHSQEVIASASSYIESDVVLFSWTLGESIIETFEGTGNILTHGFHQTKLLVFEIDDEMSTNRNIKAYPNPVKDFIQISIEIKDELKDYSYSLYNLSGKMLIKDKITSTDVNVSFENLKPSIYYLKVNGNNIIKVFKIIKK